MSYRINFGLCIRELIRGRELIDLDDVIRDFNPHLNFVWNRENPNNKKNLPRSWNLSENYGHGINEFYQEKHAEEIYTKAPVIPGAIRFLEELMRIKQVYIITKQPNKKIEEYTKYWIKKNKVPRDELKFMQDKTKIRGNYLLDDAVDNLEAVKNARSSTPVCFNRKWNREWTGLRVYNYDQFLDLVRNHN